jgi:hypothetical protein
VNNSRPFELIQFKTDTRKNSFFSKTIVDWNHLEDSVVCAKTVEGFNSALQPLSFQCIYNRDRFLHCKYTDTDRQILLNLYTFQKSEKNQVSLKKRNRTYVKEFIRII